jgi:PEGA domain-containing protein
MRRCSPYAAILLLTLSAQASAQDPAAMERAKESFKAGATAYGAGEYLAAIQAFEAAYALTPLPPIAFSLAQALRRQYFADRNPVHLRRAVELYRRYVEEVPLGGRRADALDALSQLEPLLAAQPATESAALTPSQPQRQTRVMITSETPQARLSLDRSEPAPSPLIREVTPGKHGVVVAAEGFYSAEREITAVDGELVLVDVPLRERPSTLVIRTHDDADVYVDGNFVSKAGEGLTLGLSSGRHHVSVAKNGHRVWSRDLDLERGKTRVLDISLPPTAQRLASSYFFIGGGAALGAGLVFSAFAIRAENRAEEFLGYHAVRNVTPAELSEFEDAIEDRGRFRAATALCWGASLGLFITGFILHEADAPDPQELFRVPSQRDSASAGRGKARRWQLDLTPPGSQGGTGASFGMSF